MSPRPPFGKRIAPRTCPPNPRASLRRPSRPGPAAEGSNAGSRAASVAGDGVGDPADSDAGRNQDINARLARMHPHKDHLKEEYLAKLDELDKQMAEAAIAQHKREVLAEKVAEQAVRDAKMTRVTQLGESHRRVAGDGEEVRRRVGSRRAQAGGPPRAGDG